jgi:hypothetical protein
MLTRIYGLRRESKTSIRRLKRHLPLPLNPTTPSSATAVIDKAVTAVPAPAAHPGPVHQTAAAMAGAGSFLADLNDPWLKPRLLKSLVAERLPQPGGGELPPSELASVLHALRMHGLLSEILQDHPPDPRLAEAWRAAVDAWVERLGALVESDSVCSLLIHVFSTLLYSFNLVRITLLKNPSALDIGSLLRNRGKIYRCFQGFETPCSMFFQNNVVPIMIAM